VGIDRPNDGDTPDDVPARQADTDTDAAPLLDRVARMAEHIRYRSTFEDISRPPATPGTKRSPSCAPPGSNT
jgi:hypothetical protein